MTMIEISLFTDPGCPWAFSAEPFRRKIEWLYGDHAAWELVMVGLREDPAEFEAKGHTPAMMAAAAKQIAAAHGMPIDSSERERLNATLPACRAVVAARLNSPGHQQTLLRAIQVRGFAGELIDEPATIAAAAADAEIDAHDLEQWSAQGETLVALASDMHRARHPLPAALVLDARLADWEGGRRYTCPSYEIRVDGSEPVAIPGFQPWPAYDVALANLAPDAPRREDPESVSEVLEWAAEPLATREVAVVMGIEHEQAAAALAEVAERRDVGAERLLDALAERLERCVELAQIFNHYVGLGKVVGSERAGRDRYHQRTIGAGAGDVAWRVTDHNRSLSRPGIAAVPELAGAHPRDRRQLIPIIRVGAKSTLPLHERVEDSGCAELQPRHRLNVAGHQRAVIALVRVHLGQRLGGVWR